MDKKIQHVPVGLVLALGLKGVVLGVSPADAAIAVSLVGLLVVREYLVGNKKYNELENETSTKLSEMKDAIEMQNKVIKLQAEEFDKLRNTMTGIKLQFGNKEQTNLTGIKKFGP